MGVNNIKGLRANVQPQTPERTERPTEPRAESGQQHDATQAPRESDFRQQQAPRGLPKAALLASNLTKLRTAAGLVGQFARDLKVQSPQLFGSAVLTGPQKAQRALDFLLPYAQHLAVLVPASQREQPAAAMLATLEQAHVFDEVPYAHGREPRDVVVEMLIAETPEAVREAYEGGQVASEQLGLPSAIDRANTQAPTAEVEEGARGHKRSQKGVLAWVRGVIDARKDAERGEDDWGDKVLVAAAITIIALGFIAVALLTLYR